MYCLKSYARLFMLFTAALPAFQQLYGQTEIKYARQQINYYAPDASEVFLVWGINGWQNPPLEISDAQTKLIKGLRYTAMNADCDTFRAEVEVPFGSIINYVFWINKNKSGAETDLWDTNAGPDTKDYHARAMEEGPVTVIANLAKYVPPQPPSIVDFGAYILAFTGVLLFLTALFNFFLRNRTEADIPFKMISLGFSLFIFLLLIRSEIIGLPFSPESFFGKSKTMLLAAGYDDLFYAVVLTLLFLLPVFLSGKRIVKTMAYRGYAITVALSVFVALGNIHAVKNLGRPFNYQWLYYSDFLGSAEAKSAMAANSSLVMFLNTLLICLSVLLLSHVLINIFKLLQRIPMSKYPAIAAVALLPASVITLSYGSEIRQLDKGKLQNPVSSFLSSVINARSTPSLFDMDLPEEMKNFNAINYIKEDANFKYRDTAGIKNVLLIVLESAAAEYFDLYGGNFNITPNLNALSNHAVLFENAYAHAPASNKSLVSILCAIYPWISYQSLTQEKPNFVQPSLSSELKQKGFRTSFFTSSDFRFQRGDEFLRHRDFDVIEDFTNIQCEMKFNLENNEYLFGDGIDDECIAQRLADWLDEDSATPFFSMLWTMQGHYPYFFNGQEKDFGVDNPLLNRYLNIIAHYDKVIGNVIQILNERGLFENTLVAVVGDHGEAFGRHDQFGHGSKIQEENLRVPFMLINPRLFNATRISSLSGLKDIAPTVLAAMNFPAPAEWQGINLLGRASQKRLFFFAPWSSFYFGFREGNMKIILDESNNKFELFDLASDPLETINLAEEQKTLISTARQQTASWMQHHDAYIRELLRKNSKETQAQR